MSDTDNVEEDEDEVEMVVCRRCEGGGRLYADGKPHPFGDNARTIPCPECDGEGRIVIEE